MRWYRYKYRWESNANKGTGKEASEQSGQRTSHGSAGSSLRCLLASLCFLRLFLGTSLLALLGHLRQTLVIQFGFHVSLVVASAKASIVCFANGSEELVQVLDSITQCVQSRGVVYE